MTPLEESQIEADSRLRKFRQQYEHQVSDRKRFFEDLCDLQMAFTAVGGETMLALQLDVMQCEGKNNAS